MISVVNQYYEAILYDMFVIKGNTAIFKCIVPSFVADYVSVVSWEDTDGDKYSITPNTNFGINFYHCSSYAYVIISFFFNPFSFCLSSVYGNLIFKYSKCYHTNSIYLCIVVLILYNWNQIHLIALLSTSLSFIPNIYIIFLVVNQLYTVNVMDESVLHGNTAILKCHIPSFVADYVFVSGWTSDVGDEYSINANQVYGIGK